MKIRRGARRILVGKCEGKKSWRGLVANMDVSLQGIIFNLIGSAY
jgi:hypothetical protein